MQRKRKLGNLLSEDVAASDRLKNKQLPIDLTLSDEDDGLVDNGHPTTNSDNLVILSDSDNEDEVLFVKNTPALIQESKKTRGSSSSKTINDVLKDKNTGPSIPKPLPPLLLSTPASISSHTPCSVHFDILPSTLAEQLYKTMIKESKTWTKNKWYLNDKLVESNHSTCFYHSEVDGGRFDEQWYMGRKLNEKLDNNGIEEGRSFVKEMDSARSIIEEFVNEQLKDRKRYGLEYDGQWKANVAASNCYRGGAEVSLLHVCHFTQVNSN